MTELGPVARAEQAERILEQAIEQFGNWSEVAKSEAMNRPERDDRAIYCEGQAQAHRACMMRLRELRDVPDLCPLYEAAPGRYQ